MQRRQALGWLMTAGAAAVTTAGRSAESQGTATTPTPQKTKADVNALVVNYIAAWNEQDPKRRLEIVTKTMSRRSPAPKRHSPQAAACASLYACAGTPRRRASSRSSGNPSGTGSVAGLAADQHPSTTMPLTAAAARA